MPHVVVEVLEADELALLLKELVILGDILHDDVVSEIDGPLDIAVVRTGHGSVHRLVGAGNQRFVALNVMGDVGTAVPQSLLIEYTYVRESKVGATVRCTWQHSVGREQAPKLLLIERLFSWTSAWITQNFSCSCCIQQNPTIAVDEKNGLSRFLCLAARP